MDILNPPKSYLQYSCFTHGLSGPEFLAAQAKFYQKNPEYKTEICNVFNWLYEARHNNNLPIEKTEIRDSEGKKHGQVVSLMIYNIEYWIEGKEMKQRKIYTGEQGVLELKGKVEIPVLREPGDESPF